MALVDNRNNKNIDTRQRTNNCPIDKRGSMLPNNRVSQSDSIRRLATQNRHH